MLGRASTRYLRTDIGLKRPSGRSGDLAYAIRY